MSLLSWGSRPSRSQVGQPIMTSRGAAPPLVPPTPMPASALHTLTADHPSAHFWYISAAVSANRAGTGWNGNTGTFLGPVPFHVTILASQTRHVKSPFALCELDPSLTHSHARAHTPCKMDQAYRTERGDVPFQENDLENTSFNVSRGFVMPVCPLSQSPSSSSVYSLLFPKLAFPFFLYRYIRRVQILYK